MFIVIKKLYIVSYARFKVTSDNFLYVYYITASINNYIVCSVQL